MNWAEIEDGWDGMQELLRSFWPRITQDDLTFIGRSRIRLVETLQRIYQLDEHGAESAVCDFEKNIRKPGAVV
jgi:hypothetical protein